MKSYRVLKKSFIGGSLRQVGEIVDFDGKPGSNLELIGGKSERRSRGAEPADPAPAPEAAPEIPAA